MLNSKTILCVPFFILATQAQAGGGGGGSSRPRPTTPAAQTIVPNLNQPPLQVDRSKDQKIIACKGSVNVNVHSLEGQGDNEFGVNINKWINNGTGLTPRGQGFDAQGFVGEDGSTYLELNKDPGQRILIQAIPGLGLRGVVSAGLSFGGGISLKDTPISCDLLPK
jgi:hypothetical protein